MYRPPPMLPDYSGDPWISVQITGTSGSGYTFVEVESTNTPGSQSPPTTVQKTAGQFADQTSLAYSLTGATFAVGGYALARQAPGCPGYVWELIPIDSSTQSPMIAYCATTGPLPSCTYANNGPATSGVGATLTANANGALITIDGPVVPQVGGNVLVWQQANPVQNGLYTVVSLGSATTPWQLVRTPGADSNPNIIGQLVFVTAGTQIFQRLFVQQQPVNTSGGAAAGIRFGFDSITFGVVGPPLYAGQNTNVIISTAAPNATYPTFQVPPGGFYLVTFGWTMGLPNSYSIPNPSNPCFWSIQATPTLTGNDNVPGPFPVGTWALPAGISPPEMLDTRSSTMIVNGGATISIQANLIASSNIGGIDVDLYMNIFAEQLS